MNEMIEKQVIILDSPISRSVTSGSLISGSILSGNMVSSSFSPLWDASNYSAESNIPQLGKVRKRRNIPTDPLGHKAIRLLKEAREAAFRGGESFSHLVKQLAPELEAAGVPNTQVRQVIKDCLGDIPAPRSTIIDTVLRKGYNSRYVNPSFAHPHESEPASGSVIIIEPAEQDGPDIIDPHGNSGREEIRDFSDKSGAVVQNEGLPELAPHQQLPQMGTVSVPQPGEVTYNYTITVRTSNFVTTYQPSGVDVVDAHDDSSKEAPRTSFSGLISMVGEVIKGALPESPYNPSPAPGVFTSCLSSSVAGSGAVFGNFQSDPVRTSARSFLFGL